MAVMQSWDLRFFVFLTVAALLAQAVGLYYAYLVGRQLGRSMFAALLATAFLAGVVTTIVNLALVVGLDAESLAPFAPYLSTPYKVLAIVRLIGTGALMGVAIRSYTVWR